MTVTSGTNGETAAWSADRELVVRLMDEIAAGSTPDAGALGQVEDYRMWRDVYQKFFPGRIYPRAQAFLNSSLGRKFLGPEYLYGTALLIRHESAEIRLVHLLDSERFLYFWTSPRWSEAQVAAYRERPDLGHELWSRTDVSRDVGIGAELRQICHKYAAYLGENAAAGPDRSVPLMSHDDVTHTMATLKGQLATDLGRLPPGSELSGREHIAGFALLDLFDLDYLIQLRSNPSHVLNALKRLGRCAGSEGSLRLVAGASDDLLRPFVPRWCPPDLVKQVLLFPFASQSLRSASESDRVGGDDVVFVGFLAGELDRDKIDNLRTVANLIIGTSLNELRRLLVLEEARHTSVAAIMGRNLSHNIGSHVLHWLVLNEEEAVAREEVPTSFDRVRASIKKGAVLRAHFLRYLRARMDYVATATRRTTRWSNSLPARALVEPFSASKHAHEEYAMVPEQDLLLQNLVRSDGMSDVTVQGAPGASQDVRVAIPHGWVGRQAFDTILENIIRNAAKHRNSGAGANTNQFTVTFKENPKHPEYLEVRIEDQLTLWDVSAENMKAALHEGMCDPEGRPMLSRLGFKEMRISAAFLRMIEPGRVDDLHYPDLISLQEVADSKPVRVAHVFYLERASEVLVVADNRLGLSPQQTAAWVRIGVTVVDPGDRAMDRIATYRFVVLIGAADGPVASWLRKAKASDRKLPVRVLHSHELDVRGGCPLADENLRRVVERLSMPGAEVGDSGGDAELSVTAELYDLWLGHHFGSHRDVAVAAFHAPGWIKHVAGDLVELTRPPQDSPEELDAAWDVIRDSVGSRPVGVFARHWFDPAAMKAFRDAHPTVRFIEGYSGNSPFQRFLADDVNAEEAALSLRELRESILANILIVDERLAGEVKKDTNLDTRRDTRPDPQLVKDRLRAWHKGVWLRGAEVVSQVEVQRNGEISLQWDVEPGVRFMFAAVHYGIIEKIAEALKMDRRTCAGRVIEAIRHTASQVVVFSGRGRPDLPPNVRFVDYTSLEAWFKEGKRALVVGLGGL